MIGSGDIFFVQMMSSSYFPSFVCKAQTLPLDGPCYENTRAYYRQTIRASIMVLPIQPNDDGDGYSETEIARCFVFMTDVLSG